MARIEAPSVEANAPGRRWSLPSWTTARLIPAAVLVALFATFSLVASNFCTVPSVMNLLVRTSIMAILGLAALVVLTVGAVDFSLGAVIAVSGIATLVLMGMGLPIWLSMVLAVGVGGVIGLANGILVAGLRLPPFLTTLAVAIVIYGVLGVVFLNPSSSRDQPPPLPESLGHLANVPVLHLTRRDASGAVVEVFPGISWVVIIAIAVAVLAHVVLNRTRVGRTLLLVGNCPEAARFSGIGVVRVKILAFVCAGLLAGLAAVLLTSHLMLPPVGLQGYEFMAIECAILGGASLWGGRGSVVGTVVGGSILSTLDKGLAMTSADHLYLPMLLNGLILLATVALDRLRGGGSAAALA